MRKARLSIKLSIDGFVSYENAIDIGNPYVEAFEPIDVCDNPFAAYVAGGVTYAQAKKIHALRKDYATDLARILAEQLVAIMELNDTDNGYPKRKNAREPSRNG